MNLIGPNGERYFAVPLRFYFEYGHGTAKSKNSVTSTVDITRNSYTLGADFLTSSLFFAGFNIQYADVHDRGTQLPFVFSLDTQKDFVGGQFYISRYVMPDVLAGFSVEYHRASGRSVYNLAVINNERGNYYSFTPYLLREFPVNQNWRFSAGIAVNFNKADFDYDLNVPPRATIHDTVLRLPVTAEYTVARNFTISGTLQWNQILSIETFNNMPRPDRSTMTLSAGARYNFDSGTSVYGRLSHDVFDDAYRSTRFMVGLSVVPGFLGRAGPMPPPPTPVR